LEEGVGDGIVGVREGEVGEEFRNLGEGLAAMVDVFAEGGESALAEGVVVETVPDVEIEFEGQQLLWADVFPALILAHYQVHKLVDISLKVLSSCFDDLPTSTVTLTMGAIF
jgi:hypothetical protein